MGFSAIAGSVIELGENLGNLGSSIVSGVTSGLTTLGNKFVTVGTSIINGITSGVQTILSDIFVPDNANLQTQINNITSKFAFVTDLKNVGASLYSLIAGATDTTPTVKVNMASANSKYDYGQGEAVVLDFRWYQPYKALVDIIIVAFVYAMYFWRLYTRLPAIISGAPAFSSGSSTSYTISNNNQAEIGSGSETKYIN